MSIVGGPLPSLARDVDAEPRTITATIVAVALANILEPSQDHPTVLDILALGLSLQLSFRVSDNPPGKMHITATVGPSGSLTLAARDAYSIPLQNPARHRGQSQIRCTWGSGFHPQCLDQQCLS